jgi:ribose transport system permease protein
VTIGMLSITTAGASIIAGGYTIPGLTGLTFMGTERYDGIPAPVWIVALLFVVGTLFLTRTRDGIRLMSVGGNAEAVRRSGIHSDRYKLLGFIISATCAALGGLVTTATVTEASPDASPGIIFTALTAVALAGVSLAGGRGSLPRVLVGALILATISNGLTIKGIDPYWGTGVTGVLLLGSISLEKWISATVSRRLVTSAQASVHTGTR